jgi:hypothetical protein
MLTYSICPELQLLRDESLENLFTSTIITVIHHVSVNIASSFVLSTATYDLV